MEMQPGIKSAETPSAGFGLSKSRSSCLLFVSGVPAALRSDPDSVPSTQLCQHPNIPSASSPCRSALLVNQRKV